MAKGFLIGTYLQSWLLLIFFFNELLVVDPHICFHPVAHGNSGGLRNI